MLITCLDLLGLKALEPRIFEDERGCFWESYRRPLYESSGIELEFLQDNVSVSCQHTIRGLHYQRAQAKLVFVLSGAIWDVAVDIRKDSPTYGQWIGLELNDSNRKQFFIPDGFAHGFCVLSKSAIVQYKVSQIYDPEKERSIRWNDPSLAIAWPAKDPILSMRDKLSPFFEKKVCS